MRGRHRRVWFSVLVIFKVRRILWSLSFAWSILLSSHTLRSYFTNDLLCAYSYNCSSPSGSWWAFRTKLPSWAWLIHYIISIFICEFWIFQSWSWLRASPFIHILMLNFQMVIEWMIFKSGVRFFLGFSVPQFISQSRLDFYNLVRLAPLHIIAITWAIRKHTWRCVEKFKVLIIIEWVILSLLNFEMPFIDLFWDFFDLFFVILEWVWIKRWNALPRLHNG